MGADPGEKPRVEAAERTGVEEWIKKHSLSSPGQRGMHDILEARNRIADDIQSSREMARSLSIFKGLDGEDDSDSAYRRKASFSNSLLDPKWTTPESVPKVNNKGHRHQKFGGPVTPSSSLSDLLMKVMERQARREKQGRRHPPEGGPKVPKERSSFKSGGAEQLQGEDKFKKLRWLLKRSKRRAVDSGLPVGSVFSGNGKSFKAGPLQKSLAKNKDNDSAKVMAVGGGSSGVFLSKAGEAGPPPYRCQ